MAAGRAAACQAPAKLNLYLDVLGKRDDGYHDLETLFVTLPWGDDVRIEATYAPEPGDVEIVLHATGAVTVPEDERNLAWRAARAYLDALAASTKSPKEHPQRLDIHLEKRVPACAGLGGGSSDAAAVLRLLSGDLLPALTKKALKDVARSLGADVPFFLVGGAAQGRDRGDRVTVVKDVASFEVVLILPPFGCETSRVFGHLEDWFHHGPSGGMRAMRAAWRSGDPKALREAHYNGLAVPAVKAYPELGRFMAQVEQHLGREPALSGSGSALFDIPDVDEAQAVLARLEGLPGQRLLLRT